MLDNWGSLYIPITCIILKIFFLTAVLCPYPVSASHSRLIIQGQKPGDSALYICKIGYVFPDGSRVKSNLCGDDFKWTRIIPGCKGKPLFWCWDVSLRIYGTFGMHIVKFESSYHTVQGIRKVTLLWWLLGIYITWVCSLKKYISRGCRLQLIYLISGYFDWHLCTFLASLVGTCGLMVRVSVSRLRGRWFEPGRGNM